MAIKRIQFEEGELVQLLKETESSISLKGDQMPVRRPRTKSLVVIAKMLGAEGFSQQTANMVRAFTKRKLP